MRASSLREFLVFKILRPSVLTSGFGHPLLWREFRQEKPLPYVPTKRAQRQTIAPSKRLNRTTSSWVLRVPGPKTRRHRSPAPHDGLVER